MAEPQLRQAERPPPSELSGASVDLSACGPQSKVDETRDCRRTEGLPTLAAPRWLRARVAIASESVSGRDRWWLRLRPRLRQRVAAMVGPPFPAASRDAVSTEQHCIAGSSRVSGAGAGTVSLTCVSLWERESIACDGGSVRPRAGVDSWESHRRASAGRGATTAHARVAAAAGEPGDAYGPTRSTGAGAAQSARRRRAFGSSGRRRSACSPD